MKKIILDLTKYFGVSLIAAIINITFLYIFTEIFKINYLISNVLSFTLGLFTNYILSKKYVFKNNKLSPIIEFIIYTLIGILGLIIDTFVLWICTKKLGIYYMISKILSTGVTFIWNFSIRKLLYHITDKKLGETYARRKHKN